MKESIKKPIQNKQEKKQKKQNYDFSPRHPNFFMKKAKKKGVSPLTLNFKIKV